MVVNKVKTNFLVFVGELDHLGTNIIQDWNSVNSVPGPAQQPVELSQYLGTADCFVFTPSNNHNYSAASQSGHRYMLAQGLTYNMGCPVLSAHWQDWTERLLYACNVIKNQREVEKYCQEKQRYSNIFNRQDLLTRVARAISEPCNVSSNVLIHQSSHPCHTATPPFSLK